MPYKTMADYYAAQDILPTDAKLKTLEDVERYAEARRVFLNDKLYLPARLFNGADLVEFGPDSGENALAFAMWGANCDLVEPNVKAHKRIRDYFDTYAPLRSERICGESISEYAEREPMRQYDFVIAEGFIYTVQPATLWIDLFSRLLQPGGFALISYYERYGGWVELFTKLIYSRFKALTGWDSANAALALFSNKWATIPHTRTIQQWTMDVLENPFVRLRYFLDAETLCRDMETANMRPYSSWPQYRNGLAVRWHKSPGVVGERANFLRRQQLSYLIGTTALLGDDYHRDLGAVVMATDALIDGWNDDGYSALAAGLRTLWHASRSCVVYGDANQARWAVESLMACADILQAGNASEITHYCQNNIFWLKLWGMPNHFAVFQKE